MKTSTADRPLWPFTIWEFRSVDGRQVVISVRWSEPDDMKYQHEYQKILWRGQAFNKLDAYNRSAIKDNGREVITR